MNVLVLGGGGYIGSIMCQYLLENSCNIRIIDNFVYGTDKINFLYNKFYGKIEIVNKNIYDIDNNDLENIDYIIDLAGLPNDPTAELHPTLCENTGESSIKVAKLASIKGIKRYIYMSSCSVYGDTGELLCDESTKTNPLTTYAKVKLNVENNLYDINKFNNLPIIILRNATTYGTSYRQRLDLFINGMCVNALLNKKIDVHGNGLQYRPIIHVRDVARATLELIKQEEKLDSFTIFNLGTSNTTILKIAKSISKAFGAQLNFIESQADKRNYKVSFNKFNSTIDFNSQYTFQDTIKEFERLYDQKKLANLEDAYSLEVYKKLYTEEIQK